MKHIIVTGDVQGVGFRQYIRYKARRLNIKGWVKNLPDGKVEAVFFGEPKNVEIIIKISNRGPFLAKVENVKIKDLEDQKFDNFDIIKI